MYVCIYKYDDGESYLNVISKKFVKLSDLSRNTEVDGTITDFNNKTTENIGVDLVGDLKLLALTDKRGLGNRGLETVDGLCVERSSRGDGSFYNSLSSVGESLELVGNGREKTQSVVFGKNTEEVGDGAVDRSGGRESRDNSLLVFSREGRVAEDGLEFLVLAEDSLKSSQRSLGGGESRRLDRGSILEKKINIYKQVSQ